MEIAGRVMGAARTWLSGLRQVVAMGLAGTKALNAMPYAAHYIFEGLSAGEVDGKAALLRSIGTRHGVEIPNSVPHVVYATPFAPLHNILGPAGERWVPLHGIIPSSTVVAFHRDVDRCLDAHRESMLDASIYVGRIFSSLGAGAFLYEPAIYWKDEQTIYHRTMLDPAYQASLPKYPLNPAAATLVRTIRTELMELFHRYGAGHLQVGKQYPYLRDRDPGAVALLKAIKAELDPKGLINPGALGL